MFDCPHRLNTPLNSTLFYFGKQLVRCLQGKKRNADVFVTARPNESLNGGSGEVRELAPSEVCKIPLASVHFSLTL